MYGLIKCFQKQAYSHITIPLQVGLTITFAFTDKVNSKKGNNVSIYTITAQANPNIALAM